MCSVCLEPESCSFHLMLSSSPIEREILSSCVLSVCLPSSDRPLPCLLSPGLIRVVVHLIAPDGHSSLMLVTTGAQASGAGGSNSQPHGPCLKVATESHRGTWAEGEAALGPGGSASEQSPWRKQIR